MNVRGFRNVNGVSGNCSLVQELAPPVPLATCPACQITVLYSRAQVKSPRDDCLDDQLEQAPPGTIVGGARSDPTFNRIARHILKAVKQFDTVNPDHSLPNVLVFVNHDDASNFNDLYETVTGYARGTSGGQFPFHTHIAEQRLGDMRARIDLYLWLDDNRKRRRIGGFLWCEANPEHVAALKTLLGNIMPEKFGNIMPEKS